MSKMNVQRDLEELKPSKSIKICLKYTAFSHKGHKGGSSPVNKKKEKVGSANNEGNWLDDIRGG